MHSSLPTIRLGLSLEYPILGHDYNITAPTPLFVAVTFSISDSLSSLLTSSRDLVGIFFKVRTDG